MLTITALIGALAYPQIERSLAVVALSQAKHSLVADLRAARSRALTRDGAETLTLENRGQSYSWNGANARELPSGLRLTEVQDQAVAFFPDGSAVAGRLVLSDGRRQVVIDIAPTSLITDVRPGG